MNVDAYIFVFGLTLFLLGLASGTIKNRWHISEPVLALLVGLAVGPIFGILPQPVEHQSREMMMHVAEFALVIALIDVALTLPRDYLQRQWRTLGLLLGAVMPLMWLISALLVWLLLGLEPWHAVLLGAVLTPTDPVVASAVVSGRHAGEWLPPSIRNGLIAESGSNDVLALPLVMFGVFMVLYPPGKALEHWALETLAWGVALSIILGLAVGAFTVRLLHWIRRSPSADDNSLTTVAATMALFLMAGTNLLGSDGLLAAFVAGLVLNRGLTSELIEQKQEFHETMRRFFELPAFLALGLLAPWEEWLDSWQQLLPLALAILLLRRPVPVLVMRKPLRILRARRDALFFGWFGPIGIAAVFYALHAVEKTHEPHIWVAASFVVATSILVHGTTATGFTRSYTRERSAHDEGASSASAGSAS